MNYMISVLMRDKSRWLLYVNGKPLCFGDIMTISYLLNSLNSDLVEVS